MSNVEKMLQILMSSGWRFTAETENGQICYWMSKGEYKYVFMWWPQIVDLFNFLDHYTQYLETQVKGQSNGTQS